MKNKILIKRVLLPAILLVSALGLHSCSDFLNVRPKSEILAQMHFDRESGYFDQLIGVYTKMCEQNMYGRNMTFGLMEVVSQNYDLNASSAYTYAASYDYEMTTIKSIIDAMWLNSYNCIANLNILLQYIDEVDPAIFSDNNYSIYKGEALGLRAFLHLDMLRIFAPSPASSANAKAIPYVKEYSPKITEHSTVTQVLEYIIADLLEAIELLKVDPWFASPTSTEKYNNSGRRNYFNYFAANLTLARAYLYKGDKVNALKYAQVIIDEKELLGGAFSWVHFTAIETTFDYECDRLFSPEHIFRLRINNMDEIIRPYFTSNATSNKFSPSETKADIIFEKSSKGYGNDYRMLKGFAYDGAEQYLSKFWQYEQSARNNQYPLMRMSEAYYIAAEALKDSSPLEAIALLNEVRSNRNLADFTLPDNLTSSEIQAEIKKEYRKEFLGEGQYFFYHKRLNLSTIEGAGVNATDAVYVIPMPDNELEFGGR